MCESAHCARSGTRTMKQMGEYVCHVLRLSPQHRTSARFGSAVCWSQPTAVNHDAPGKLLFHKVEPFKADLAGHRAVLEIQVGHLYRPADRFHDVGAEADKDSCSLPDTHSLQALPGRNFQVRNKIGDKLDEVVHSVFSFACEESESRAQNKTSMP